MARSVSSLTDDERSRYAALIERRHSFENLVVMCAVHSAVIDDVAQDYSVADVLELKRLHESAVDAHRREGFVAARPPEPAALPDPGSPTDFQTLGTAVLLLDGAPAWSQTTLRALATSSPVEFAWLAGQVGDPPDPARATALIDAWPPEVADGSTELAKAIIRLAESGGQWPASSTGWERLAERFEASQAADLLTRAAVNATVGSHPDPDRRERLLAEAQRLDPDLPRLRIELLDDDAPADERMAVLDELDSDDEPLMSLIAAQKAIAAMQLGDLAAAMRFASEAERRQPDAMYVRMVRANVQVQRARIALIDDTAIALAEAREAIENLLALRTELVAMARWRESCRTLMLAADAHCLMRDLDAARALLDQAHDEEVTARGGAEVLGDAALRAGAPALALKFCSMVDVTDDAVRRIAATAALDLRRDDPALHLATLEEIARASGPEREQAAFARLAVCLPPLRLPWDEAMAEILDVEPHRRTLSSLRIMALAASGAVIRAEMQAARLPDTAWAAEVRLRLAHERGNLSGIREAATTFLRFAPDSAGRLLIADGYLRSGDLHDAETVLIGVAHDPNAPPRSRADAYSRLVKLLVDQQRWERADEEWCLWHRLSTDDLAQPDTRVSAWQVRLARHGGGRPEG